jgi:hypothetical protein
MKQERNDRPAPRQERGGQLLSRFLIEKAQQQSRQRVEQAQASKQPEAPKGNTSLPENQTNQESKLKLPSYLTDYAREILTERFTHHTKESLEGTGWDSFAELVFDGANILPKPNRPNIPPDDLDAIDEEDKLQHMDANDWEERAIDLLRQDEDMHLIPDFKRDMQEYRDSVKSIVQLWKEKGLL